MPGTQRTVVAGGGRVGRNTARVLDDRGQDVVIVEENDGVVEEIADEYFATVIRGDATRPSILEQAGLERTDVVAALTGETGTNLAICMAATHLAPDVETVMRSEVDVGDEYAPFVDEVVFTAAASARAAANAVEREVRSLEDVSGTIDVVEIRVAEGAPVAGKSLTEVTFPRGAIVVSDAEGHRIAGSDTRLEAGNSYLVATEPAVSDEVMNLMRG
jgi:trk system potassium uptake protein TrkA